MIGYVAKVWTEDIPERCTGMMLDSRGVNGDVTSTDDILFGERTYTRLVKVALTDADRPVSTVAAFTGAYDCREPKIVGASAHSYGGHEAVTGWAFFVSMDGDRPVSLTRQDRKAITDRLVRSAMDDGDTVRYVPGLRQASVSGCIGLRQDGCYIAKVVG